jgi:putative nucleotidyltransferase with HDIG domain
VIQGERVIAAHEQIQDEDIERLRAYQSALAAQGKLEPGAFHISHIAGTITLNLIFLSIFGFMLLFYRPTVYRSFRHILLLAALYFGVTAAAAVMAGSNAPDSLVPIAFPVLVVAVLWDGRMALTLALVIAIVLSTQPPFGGQSPRVLMIAGGAAAALSVRVVRRRAEGLILGAVIAGAYAIASLGLGLLLSWSVLQVFQSAAWGAVNGIASALLAMGLMPLFEAFTKITTDQTLLELTDMNRPLLKRLSLEASGTYAHSINVANLAEAAARVVDGNALLARVGAYYHDIGKMATPQYFIENQARGRNPHDRLDPATSAAIVRGHVLEGMRMADQANLPDSVRAFLPEHHGTQAIGFFLDQARQAQPDAELNPADFSYPGPRPRSKETAITMLADSVESAAKVLQDPTPERIRALVDRIVDGKVSRGQLDESPLTFEDVARIKEQFAVVLTGMYHHRIDYPPAPRPADAPASSGAGQARA